MGRQKLKRGFYSMREVSDIEKINHDYTSKDARNDALRVWAKENKRKYTSVYNLAHRMILAERAGTPLKGRDITEESTIQVAPRTRRTYTADVKRTPTASVATGELRLPIKSLTVVEGNLVITF